MHLMKCLRFIAPFFLAASFGIAHSNEHKKAGISARPSPYEETARKSHASTKRIEGKIVPYCAWYNPHQWLPMETNVNSSAEYVFKLKNGNAFAMILSEANEVPLDNIASTVIEGAKLNGVTHPVIIEQELLLVNGAKVLSLKWSGEINGARFVYFYFIYSDRRGTVQSVAYTLESLYEQNKRAMELFLEGYCMQDASK